MTAYQMDFCFSVAPLVASKIFQKSLKKENLLLNELTILQKNSSNLWRYWALSSQCPLSNWSINRTGFWQDVMLGQIAPVNKVNYHISENLSFEIRHIRNKKMGSMSK